MIKAIIICINIIRPEDPAARHVVLAHDIGVFGPNKIMRGSVVRVWWRVRGGVANRNSIGGGA